MFVHSADKLAEMRTKFHVIQAKLIMSVWCFTVHCFPPAPSLHLSDVCSHLAGVVEGAWLPSSRPSPVLEQETLIRDPTPDTAPAASADLSPAQTRRFLVVCRRTKNWFCIIISSTNTLKRKSPLLGPAVTRHLTVYRQQAALCQLERAG